MDQNMSRVLYDRRMKSGTVEMLNRSRGLVAIRLDDDHSFTVVEIVGGWSPQIGERVRGDLDNFTGLLDLVRDGGLTTSVFILNGGCSASAARDHLQ